jgi:PmbA protein
LTAQGVNVIREIITGHNASIKLGIVDSQIGSVRTQAEEETAVRVFEDGQVGIASAVGQVDLDRLTANARDGLSFEIAYPVAPAGSVKLHREHAGENRSVDALVATTNQVLQALTSAFPNFVYSHGVQQSTMGWRMENDNGLDLSYSRTELDMSFVLKEKGSGNIFDTFVTASGPDIDVDETIARFLTHIRAFSNPAGALPTGPQRIVFPGIEGHAGDTLVKLLRSDLVARSLATGASVFSGKVGTGEALFHPALQIVDTRDADRRRVCPFDMEGTLRDRPDLDLVRDGCVVQAVASRRDAVRYDVPATGSAVGDLAQLPVSGIGRLDFGATAPTLVDLLDGEPAIMLWFESGGDLTRTGDIALPGIVLLRVEADGQVSGRYPAGTLTGNLYDVLGKNLIGVTEERIAPHSEQPFLVATMDVHA